MPSTDAASSTVVLPRATAKAAGLGGPERSAPPPYRVFVDPGASTPISNRAPDPAASPLALAQAPPTAVPTGVAVTLCPLPPAVPQVTTVGSQMKVGNGLGFPPPWPGWLPFWLPFWLWLCFLCFVATLRRPGGTWFHMLPVKTGGVNCSTPSGTNSSWA